jgi:hypothetical protein
MKTTRRTFIKQSTLATVAATGVGSFLFSSSGCAAASEKLANDTKAKHRYGFLEGEDAATIAQNDTVAEINRVPYVSTYYVQPKVNVGQSVTINYYVTDYEQKEYMLDDDSERFTIEYWVNGAKSTLRNVKAGDNSFSFKAPPKGNVLLAFQATDSKGRKSYRMYQEFKVVDPKEETIPESKIYHPDLKKFNIYNDDTHPVETTAGLTAMLAWAHDNGYRKVLLPQGRYRLDENDTVNMATNLTLDMNGATFKLNPNALAKTMMLQMVECEDSHVINGTFEGDLKEHDFKNAPSNSEWVCGVLLGPDTRDCSFENIKVVDITGYGTNTFMQTSGKIKSRWAGPAPKVTEPGVRETKYGYSAIIPISPGKFVPGDIDTQGKQIDSSDRLVNEKLVDISPLVDPFGFLQMGLMLGYQGNPSGSWVYKVSFYDAGEKYLESIEGYMYRRIYIPQGAKFARFTLFSNELSTKKGSLSLFNFRQPYNCVFRNIIHENVRCVGMCPSGFYNLLVEGCTFNNCGFASAKCAFDSEDGWDMMQDLTFRNNIFGANPHIEFLTADGLNFVMENNVMGTYMWERTRGSVYRNNKMKSAVFSTKTRNGSYPRISGNTFMSGVALSTGTVSPDCEFCIRDNIITGTTKHGVSSYAFAGAAANANSTYLYKCDIGGTEGLGAAANFVKCNLTNIQNNGGAYQFYDCTIKDSNILASVLKVHPPVHHKFLRCTIANSQLRTLNGPILLQGNTMTDVTLDTVNDWIEDNALILVDNKITTSKEYLITAGNSFKQIVLQNCTVTATSPAFNAIILKNPQAKNSKALTVAVTKSTFTGKSGNVINVIAAPWQGTLLTIYAKGNTYTGLEAINDKAFDMKTVKLLEQDPPL